MKSTKKLQSFKLHKVLLGIGVGCILVAIGLLWWDGQRQPYIGRDFSYTSDIITADNFYDLEQNRFTGTRYATPILQISRGGSAEAPTVTSKLVSKTVSGETIATINRERRVDPQTGQYLDPSGNPTEKPSYVFAPKNLQKDQTFSYRHITYDAPALMRFVEQETIDGLDVYRYEADYSDSKPLLVKDLPTPNLPEDQSLEYDPKLQIWVEPKSGWLIKYQEDTTVHLVEKATGKRIAPGVFFSSHTEDQSVEQHVAYAKSLKLRDVFTGQIAPSIILIVLVAAALWLIMSKIKFSDIISIKVVVVIVAVASAIPLIGWATGIIPLATFFFDAAMSPLTAICFLFVALGIWARQTKYLFLVTLVGSIVLILAGSQLIGALNVLPFQIDSFFFRERSLADEYGGMSAYAAFTFVMLSIVLIKSGLTTQHTPIHFAKFASGLVTMLGVFGFLIQLLQIEQAFTITFVQSLSIVSCILFIICGFTLMQLFRQMHSKPDDTRSILKALLWPSLATIPLLIIGTFAQIQQNNVQSSLQTNLEEGMTSVNSALQNRINIYTNTLSGARALFSVSDEVTSSEWSRFIQNYQLSETYPGILDIGFARVTGSNQVGTNSTEQPVDVFPQSTNPVKVPIAYIEPLTDRTLKQVGFDMLSDTARGNAIEQARDSGTSRLSDKLATPDDGNKNTDLLLLAPVYDGQPTTQKERQDAVEGYVFGSINVQDMITSVIDGLNGQASVTNIDFEIYDGLTTDSQNLVYRRYPTSNETPRLVEKSTIFLANKPWTIVYAAQPSYQLSPQEEYSPTLILIGGSITYFALLAVILMIIDLERRGKARKRAQKQYQD